MNALLRYLFTLCLLMSGVLVADAQWKIEFDTTYGVGGVSMDASTSVSLSSVHPHQVMIADDGSAFIVRKIDTPDTTTVVARITKNGTPDPAFDQDGMFALDKQLTPTTYLLVSEGGLWLAAGRAGRLELWQIDQLGRIGSTPFWQDTAREISNKLLHLRGEDTLVMWSKRWNEPESQRFIRFVVPDGVIPSSDVFIPYEENAIGISLEEAKVDAFGRFMAYGNVSDRSYAIARYNEDGRLDSEFGNAMGLAVFEKSPNDGVLWMEVLSLRQGGYVIVMPINERKGNAHDYFVRLLKINEDGSPITTFGVNGVLDIRGSQMTSRGIVECPNGDLLFASFGTYGYSHLYQIRPDGTFIPNTYGDFDIFGAIQLIRYTDDGHLYAISADPTNGKYVLSRFIVSTVTSVDQEDHSPRKIVIDQGVVRVMGATEPVTIRVFSLLGECIMTKECDPYRSVELPPSVSGTYVINASFGRDVITSVVNVVR